jgi:signal transduction histidine kinase
MSVTTLANEFNNLHTAIQGHADFLSCSDDPQTRRRATVILESTREAAKLARDLLVLARDAERA